MILAANVSEEERSKHNPAEMKRKVKNICILGAVGILAAGMIAHAVGALYTVTWDAQNALSAVEKTMDEQKDVSEYSVTSEKERCLYHASVVADALARDPETRTAKQLRRFRDMLSANYIMVYDADGKELYTDSAYINMELDSDSSSETYALTNVLNGEKSVYLESVKDNVTGKTSDLIGIRMPAGGSDDGYNVLVVSMKPVAKRFGPPFESLDDLLITLVSSYDGYLLINEDRLISYLTNRNLYMADPLEVGMKETELRGNFMGEFTLDGDSLYGLSRTIDNQIVYYFVPASMLYDG
jgi:hypothetical protein